MISQLLKDQKVDLWRLIIKNNSTKSLLKQMDGLWKRVESILEKDLTQILETIDDISYQEGQSSRSSVIRKLVNSGLKNYYKYLETSNLVKQQ